MITILRVGGWANCHQIAGKQNFSSVSLTPDLLDSLCLKFSMMLLLSPQLAFVLLTFYET